MDTSKLNRGDEVWCLGYNGPKTAVFVESFPPAIGPMKVGENKNVSVVLFNGNPELAKDSELYETKSACYSAAADRALKSSISEMRKAVEYREQAEGA